MLKELYKSKEVMRFHAPVKINIINSIIYQSLEKPGIIPAINIAQNKGFFLKVEVINGE